MELRHLRYFVAVAQTHNFTRAAELLGISQPPLSQQILRLEREIGLPLLKRLTRSVELTEAGEAFYQDACQILELSGHALEKAKGIARGTRGRLSSVSPARWRFMVRYSACSGNFSIATRIWR